MRSINLSYFSFFTASFDVLDALLVIDVASGRDVVIRITVLAVIEFLAHHVIQTATTEEQYLLERFPKVPVQRRVYHRIQQAIRVT